MVPVDLIRPRLRGGDRVRREDDALRFADSARRRGGEDSNAFESFNGKFWPPLTCNLPIESKKIDDTGTKSKGALQGL